MHKSDPELNLAKYRNKNKNTKSGGKDQKKSQDRLSCCAPWESLQEPRKEISGLAPWNEYLDNSV